MNNQESYRVYNAMGNYKTFQNRQNAIDDFEKKKKEAAQYARKTGDYGPLGNISMVSETDAKFMGW